MEKIDVLIKNFLETRKTDISEERRSTIYPSSDVLYAYLNDELQGSELEQMLAFLRNNSEAQELISKAREVMGNESGWENEEVSEALVARAKGLMQAKSPASSCPHCGKSITPFKKPLQSQRVKNTLWLALTLTFFGLSFIAHRFFYQFLAAALFFGFKWIMDQRATKTQIMIYKALSDNPESEQQHRLHRPFSRL